MSHESTDGRPEELGLDGRARVERAVVYLGTVHEELAGRRGFEELVAGLEVLLEEVNETCAVLSQQQMDECWLRGESGWEPLRDRVAWMPPRVDTADLRGKVRRATWAAGAAARELGHLDSVLGWARDRAARLAHSLQHNAQDEGAQGQDRPPGS